MISDILGFLERALGNALGIAIVWIVMHHRGWRIVNVKDIDGKE
jgi:hypothetical protein